MKANNWGCQVQDVIKLIHAAYASFGLFGETDCCHLITTAFDLFLRGALKDQPFIDSNLSSIRIVYWFESFIDKDL